MTSKTRIKSKKVWILIPIGAYHIKSKQFGFHLLPWWWYIHRHPTTAKDLSININANSATNLKIYYTDRIKGRRRTEKEKMRGIRIRYICKKNRTIGRKLTCHDGHGNLWSKGPTSIDFSLAFIGVIKVQIIKQKFPIIQKKQKGSFQLSVK